MILFCLERQSCTSVRGRKFNPIWLVISDLPPKEISIEGGQGASILGSEYGRAEVDCWASHRDDGNPTIDQSQSGVQTRPTHLKDQSGTYAISIHAPLRRLRVG